MDIIHISSVLVPVALFQFSAFSICEFCLPVSLFFLPLFSHFLFICGFWSHNSIYRLYSPWRVPQVEQEHLILPEYLNWLPVFSGVRVARSLVFYVMFCRSMFVLFLLAIVLSVLLRFTFSDYPFGIFKLFY
jgi:hypothetical protein